MNKFITFEGGEGSGKSTQAKLLAEYLTACGVDVFMTNEPFFPAIRELLLIEGEEWHPISETLLFLADRYEHINNFIKPALERGEWVICDRFTDSTIAYQGFGHQLGADFVSELSEKTYPDGLLKPDLTFVLDIPADVGVKRALSRYDGEERFERMDLSFHERVREGFLSIAEVEKNRCIVLDANKEILHLKMEIAEIVFEKWK